MKRLTGELARGWRALKRRVRARLNRPYSVGSRIQRHLLFRRQQGRFAYLPWRKPRRYTEKMMWRIMRDRREILRPVYDKIWMKEYGSARGVQSPRLLWSGQRIEDLVAASQDFGNLRWVLKPNHSSGHVSFHEGPVEAHEVEHARPWADIDHSPVTLEWSAGQARKCLIAEESIAPDDGTPLIDWKFYVFDGRAVIAQGALINGEHSGSEAFYDVLTHDRIRARHHERPIAPGAETLPANWTEMVTTAELLADGWDHIRVDLFTDGAKIWLGELTPYSGGAQVRYWPPFDERLGSYWHLPKLKANGTSVEA